MRDMTTQLRDYIESVAPIIEEEEVRSHPLVHVPARIAPTARRRGIGLGVAVAGLMLILISVALLLDGSETAPFSEPVSPVSIDVCDLLARATATAGQPVGSRTSPHESTTWEAAVCVHDGWDSGWDWRHLLFRQVPTSIEEARLLLASEDLLEVGSDLEWKLERPGIWIASVTDSRDTRFSAVAVSSDPYFFIVTYRDLDDSLAVADGVLTELAELGVS